jgi:hypothetical protein
MNLTFDQAKEQLHKRRWYAIQGYDAKFYAVSSSSDLKIFEEVVCKLRARTRVSAYRELRRLALKYNIEYGN